MAELLVNWGIRNRFAKKEILCISKKDEDLIYNVLNYIHLKLSVRFWFKPYKKHFKELH